MLGPNQQKWVNALRSGKYSQSTKKLQDDKGYCCLGVACRIAKENGESVLCDLKGKIIGATLVDQLNVSRWLGMKTNNGHIPNPFCSLTSYNDSYKKTFEEIADIIEEYAEDLFKEPR